MVRGHFDGGDAPVSSETSPSVRKHSASLKRASSPSIFEKSVRAASRTSQAALKSSSGASSTSSAPLAGLASSAARPLALAEPEPEPDATGCCSSARWTCVESVDALLATRDDDRCPGQRTLSNRQARRATEASWRARRERR